MPVTAFKLIDAPDKLMPYTSGGTAYWSVQLKPGAVKRIRFIMTYGNNQKNITANLDKWGNNFDRTFGDVQTLWKSRWQEMFKPHNSLFSGCFPVLKQRIKPSGKFIIQARLPPCIY